MTAALFERFEDLAGRVLAADVVFFVGAGFSLDSEGNSADRLIKRLLARFLAMHEVLVSPDERLDDGERIRRDAEALRDGFCRTFDIDKDRIATRETIRTLGKNYYLINDWICSAFAEVAELLCSHCRDGRQADRLAEAIHETENIWLRRLNDATEWQDRVPIDSIDLVPLRALGRAARGKALFLDTMGFNNAAIMAGEPESPNLEQVEASFDTRLLSRHFVLARLAREGLSPMLLSTNFDLLIEGAYRLSGFEQRDPARLPDGSLPPTRYPDYERVASAAQFYYANRARQPQEKLGAPPRSVSVVKIHGCADGYRRARSFGGARWEAILPSLVFTFREIQNWRQDSWSRDLVNTLLRTRTMVFCSYSTADQVLHDSIRTVYEEMAEHRRRLVSHDPATAARCDNDETTAAPAFFLGVKDTAEFHPLEVLRAASRAVGTVDPPLTRHPNYLEFHLRSDGASRFPVLDEVLAWVFHRVYRMRQQRALESDLRSIATLITGSDRRKDDIERIGRDFEALCRSEQNAASRWTEAEEHRFTFERITGWTGRFHPQLLRELALADLAVRRGCPPTALNPLREKRWYYPAGENSGWTAWGVVVELALRRMAAAYIGAPERWSEPALWSDPPPWADPAACLLPSVAVSRHPDEPAPLCLTIRFDDAERVGRSHPAEGLFRHHVHWTLSGERLPWTAVDRTTTPDAETLWNWAAGRAAATRDEARPYFEVTE